jgi:hypothetical protein
MIASTGFVTSAGQALAEQSIIDTLQPGQFRWNPERSPTGGIVIVVSLPDQRTYVYRDGARIAVSTCSTGKPGHATPTGVFTILQKDKHHHSSTYNNAPMPNMNRLTWSGIALHAGQLPGYPASHGCVRLPMEFSEKLFEITQLGMTVIVANAATYPSPVVHPGMVLASHAHKDLSAFLKATKQPVRPASAGGGHPVSALIVSSVDKKIIVLDDGVIVGEGEAIIANPERPLGNHVFILSHVDSENQELHWRTIGYYNDNTRSLELSELATMQRLRGDPAIIEQVAARMYSGTVMVTVDAPLTPDTRSTDDFVVVTNEGEV